MNTHFKDPEIAVRLLSPMQKQLTDAIVAGEKPLEDVFVRNRFEKELLAEACKINENITNNAKIVIPRISETINQLLTDDYRLIKETSTALKLAYRVKIALHVDINLTEPTGTVSLVIFIYDQATSETEVEKILIGYGQMTYKDPLIVKLIARQMNSIYKHRVIGYLKGLNENATSRLDCYRDLLRALDQKVEIVETYGTRNKPTPSILMLTGQSLISGCQIMRDIAVFLDPDNIELVTTKPTTNLITLREDKND